MLRSLMNIRLPKPISKEYLKIQDAYLKEELKVKGIVPLSELTAIFYPIILTGKGDKSEPTSGILRQR